MITTTGESSGARDQVRLERFNEALERSLQLIDEKATADNFQTALPNLKPKLLKPLQEKFVFHLKDSIKLETDRLIASYELKQKLRQLEDLTQEADRRAADGLERKDVWRPNLELSTALYAKSLPLQMSSISFLEKEIKQVEAENSELSRQLEQTMSSAEELRVEARSALQCLDDTAEEMDKSPEMVKEVEAQISRLLRQLGPRTPSSIPP